MIRHPKIAIAPIPDDGLGEAINDRLRRAPAPVKPLPAHSFRNPVNNLYPIAMDKQPPITELPCPFGTTPFSITVVALAKS